MKLRWLLMTSSFLAFALLGIKRSDADEQPTPTKTMTNSLGMKFSQIPAGEFLRGASQEQFVGDLEKEDRTTRRETPQHKVKLTRGFWMAQTEVTQAEYRAVMGTNPSWFSADGGGQNEIEGLDTQKFPVEGVSWFDAVEYCNKLSLRDELTPCYRLENVEREEGSIHEAEVTLLDGTGYRLPTEAEWEYACRAGTTTHFAFGDLCNGREANIDGSRPFRAEPGPALERTTTVASYPPNAWGLYDMHGNVWEWCQDGFDNDAYQKFATETAVDPRGDEDEPSERVLRGGCWNFYARYARSSYRYRASPDRTAGANGGFRVVRGL